MYSTTNADRYCTLNQQPASAKFKIDTDLEPVSPQDIYSPNLEQNFAIAHEVMGDIASPHSEQFQHFDSSPQAQDKSSDPNNNLVWLKQAIAHLETTVNQAAAEEQYFLTWRLHQGIEHLQAQSQHINVLAAQLEAEILKFKQTAKQVNRDYHAIQNAPAPVNSTLPHGYRTRPANIWDVRSSVIPTVIKQGNQFILTTKPVVEPAEDRVENRIKKAQERQKALEIWLEAKRQRIIDDFSGS